MGSSVNARTIPSATGSPVPANVAVPVAPHLEPAERDRDAIGRDDPRLVDLRARGRGQVAHGEREVAIRGHGRDAGTGAVVGRQDRRQGTWLLSRIQDGRDVAFELLRGVQLALQEQIPAREGDDREDCRDAQDPAKR